MADRTIKEEFDANPSAGKDLSKTYYIQAATISGDVGLDDQQLAGLVADRLGLIGNSSNTGLFFMTIPANSYNAVISPVVADYLSWQITIDTTTVPGFSDPSGWTDGSIPTQYTVADALSHDYRLYIKDDTTVFLVNTTDGLGYVSLRYDDTVGPTLTFSIALGADGTKQVIPTFTATDVSGVGPVDLMDASDDSPLFRGITSENTYDIAA